MKLVSGAAKTIREPVHVSPKRAQPPSHQIGRCGRVTFQHLHLDRQHAHPLVQIIVKVSRHTLALVFLRSV